MNELTVQKPVMPVSLRHRQVLGKIPLNGDPITVADNDRLIPASDCQAVIAEMNAALTGCDTDQAKAVARKIVGAYPNAKPDDPDTYADTITLGVSECPPDLLLELFHQVTRRPKPFPPVRGEIVEIVADLVRKRRRAKEVAIAHLREHDRRAKNPAPKRFGDLDRDEKAAFEQRMADFYGMAAATAARMSLDKATAAEGHVE